MGTWEHLLVNAVAFDVDVKFDPAQKSSDIARTPVLRETVLIVENTVVTQKWRRENQPSNLRTA